MSTLLKRLPQTVIILISIVLLGISCNHDDNKINATCFDEVLNQEEEFIDCGGPNCEPCGPRCDNGIIDSEEGHEEYGIDCGGDCPSCCDNEIWDSENEDPLLNEEWLDCGGPDPECIPCVPCHNGVHDDGETIILVGVEYDVIDCDDDPDTDCPPCSDLCNDGLVNGLEDCIDCGGVCGACDDSSCFNEVQDDFNINVDPNIAELGIDCGGCLCAPCDDPLLCNDGILNGFEEAIDCGGEFCIPCDDYDILCFDGILNGYEDFVDCYNGDDGLSSCDPCNECQNLIYDGEETDFDCGGPDCPPCANIDMNQNFMTYTITTDDESNVFYESQHASCSATYFKGIFDAAPDPDLEIPGVLGFQGGVSHTILVAIEDIDSDTLSFAHPSDFFFDNTVIPAMSNSDFAVMADDGETYYARYAPLGEGVTLSMSTMDITENIDGTVDIHLVGTFAGKLTTLDGQFDATIEGGVFDITFTQP